MLNTQSYSIVSFNIIKSYIYVLISIIIMFDFIKRIGYALDTIKQIPLLRSEIQSVDSTVSRLKWEVGRIVDWKKDRREEIKPEPKPELYGIEKEVDILSKNLYKISFERFQFVVTNLLSNANDNFIAYLRIIYTYCPDDNKSWILETFKTQIIESFGTYEDSYNVMNVNDLIQINAAFKTDLDNLMILNSDSLLADFIEKFRDDPAIEQIKTEPLFEEIEDGLIRFEIIELFEDRAIQLLIREVPSDSLLIAMRWCSEELHEKIFTNMSKRAADMLREEFSLKWPVQLSIVRWEQKEIVKIIQRLVDEWQIWFPSKDDILI